MTEMQTDETQGAEDEATDQDANQTTAEAADDLDTDDQATVTPPAEEARCEATTTVGGTLYQCALQQDHEGEHSFQPAVNVETGEVIEAELSNEDQQQAKALQRKAQSYSRGITDLLGDDLSGWIACEVCGPYFPGLHPPFNVLGGAPAEVVGACRTIAGLPSLDNMAQDAYSATCSTCHGVGKTLTGSNVQGQETIQCRDCKGKGWRPVGPERQQEHETGPQPQSVAVDSEQTEGTPDVDPWGRPKGDPDYGRLPGYAG